MTQIRNINFTAFKLKIKKKLNEKNSRHKPVKIQITKVFESERIVLNSLKLCY